MDLDQAPCYDASMAFKTMPKELIIRLLEEHEDTLSEPLARVLSRIKSKQCPNCGIPMVPKPDFDNPFNDSHIPVFQAYCSECDLVMDADTSEVLQPPLPRDGLE